LVERSEASPALVVSSTAAIRSAAASAASATLTFPTAIFFASAAIATTSSTATAPITAPSASSITTAPSTTAAAIATTSGIKSSIATTESAWTFFLWTRDHYLDRTTAEIGTVHSNEGSRTFIFVGHLNEAEAPRASRFPVHHHASAGHSAVGLESAPEFIISQHIREVADIKIHDRLMQCELTPRKK
jgi:hypothetical protein